MTTKTPKMIMKKTTKPADEAVEAVEVAEIAATESAVAEKVEVPEVATTDLIEKTAHEIENLKEDKALKLVPSLLDNIDHDFFKLGGVLSLIQANGWFMDQGYENFRAYVEAQTDIGYRKAIYLIGIYNGLVESGIKWEQVKHLGWTKLKELATLLTPDNVSEWVGLAENMTVLQLQEHIKAQTAGAAGKADAPSTDTTEAQKTTTKTFKLHADQKETVEAALDKCKHETGTDVDSVALEHICLDYLGGDSVIKKLPTLKELMQGKSVEEVLEVFGEVFPEVELEATLPN